MVGYQDPYKRNLLQETIAAIEVNDQTVESVQWVGGNDGWFTWDEFCALADVTYDSGFGGQEVAQDLIVVGDSWWLERGEYDGSEWWDFHTYPAKPEKRRTPISLLPGDWKDVTWESE